jgi:predicted dehydrogenase
MKHSKPSETESQNVDKSRRHLLSAAGTGLAGAALGALSAATPRRSRADESRPVRWGFVGTGSIADMMANVLQSAPSATLAAVSSRRMESARAFADKFDVDKSFDSWEEMAAWDGVDAIYVATPTSVREGISIAAASNGKHVLAEKPFASLPSVQRITAACRANGVVFMDGTHFVHHPRTASIQSRMADQVGAPWSVDSAFQFDLPDKSNIRYNPRLEPMGAIGDAGWYNMRAAVEYLSPDAQLQTASAYLRRDADTGAAIGGSGILVFDDGATSTWNCAFDSGAVIMDLRISGAIGSINIDDFLGQDPDGSAKYLYRKGGWGPNVVRESIRIESALSGAALMFEDFAAAIADTSLREQWMQGSERTQALLDAVWESALAHAGA